MSAPLLEVEDLTVRYRGGGATVTAVEGVSLTVAAGETVGLVGGSGAGKSSVAHAIAGLVTPARGRVVVAGHDALSARRAARRRLQRLLHLVFQDPYSALPPTMTVAAVIAEPLAIHRLGTAAERVERAAAAAEAVHLSPPGRYLDRYPHQLSGGERQRVAFARALVHDPRLILADEPTQMLDASLRAEIADLIDELRTARGVAVLHITHDLALAGRSCDRLVVMCGGRVVEQGPTGQVLAAPAHAYTAALVDAARRLYAATTPH